MNQLEQLCLSLKRKIVTLDCNVFILLIVGSISKDFISKFKRTQIFVEKDYELLMYLIKDSEVILTPNVITEASNLLESFEYQGKKIGLVALSSFCQKFSESYEKSSALSSRNGFLKFGLSDMSIENMCQVGAIAITVDFPLYGYLISEGRNALNFNHIRSHYILN
jgi:hypothetical protein